MPATIRAEILAAAPGAKEIGDRRKAIETAIKALKPGDVLLIAGKGHEDYQIVGTTKHHFSDHEVVAETSERPLMQPLWTVAEAVAATGGRPEGLSDGPLHSISIDSREIEPDALFVAIKGDKLDGHDYRRRGARGRAPPRRMVSEDWFTAHGGEKLIVVPDPLEALRALGARRARPQQGADRRGHRQRRQDHDQGSDPHRARARRARRTTRSRASTITGACR